jgi:uncharacterized protein YjaG (DUF416 family)
LHWFLYHKHVMAQTEFQTFLDGLDKALEPLSPTCQLALALACCERHFQNYVSFYEGHHWGDPELLRSVLDRAWSVVTGENPGPVTGDLLAKCMSTIPNSEQFSTPSADYAQNLAIMVVHVVEFMIRNDLKYIVMTAILARDLVDAKVQITEDLDALDPELERKIAQHPAMQAELESQRRALAMLNEVRDSDGLRTFRSAVASGLAL